MKWPPIKYFITLMLENRSFDHMLGFMKAPDYDIEGLNGGEANPDTQGTQVPVSATARYAGDFDPDPGHDFDDVTLQLYGTKNPAPGAEPNMSGFVKAYADKCGGDVPASHRIMKCYDPGRVPALTTLARKYAICDHWFSSVPGPTLPNRLFAHAGTSHGRLDIAPEYFAGFRTIYQVLDEANVSATVYADGWSALATIPYLMKFQTQFFASLDDFYQGCKRGKLSSYTFLEPRYGTTRDPDGLVLPQNDQHPDSDVAEGEKLIRRVYEEIRANKKIWESCMLVITYDEHGGLHDHVPPPRAPRPDDDTSANPSFDFTRLGVRVPAVIVSPFISPRTIRHEQFDHTTLLSSAAALFLGRQLQEDELGNRAAQAPTLLGCFDEAFYRNPRNDQFPFPDPGPSDAVVRTGPIRVNDLQEEHLKQAVWLEQRLPASLRRVRTPDEVERLKADAEQAEAYVRQVLALALANGIEVPPEEATE